MVLGLGTCAGSFRVAAVPQRSVIVLSQRQAVFFDPIHEAANVTEPGAVNSLITAAHTSKGSGERSSVVKRGAKWGPGLETN